MTIKQIEVVQYEAFANRKAVTGGFRVAILHRECADSQYDWIPHPAIFRTKERAEAFKAKILASGKHFVLKNWGKSIPAYGVL